MVYKIYEVEHVGDSYIVAVPSSSHFIGDCKFYKKEKSLREIRDFSLQSILINKVKENGKEIMQISKSELEKAIEFYNKVK